MSDTKSQIQDTQETSQLDAKKIFHLDTSSSDVKNLKIKKKSKKKQKGKKNLNLYRNKYKNHILFRNQKRKKRMELNS